MEGDTESYERPSLVQRVGFGVFGLSKRLMQRSALRVCPVDPLPTSSREEEEEYDDYGFSRSDNLFVDGISAYENSFSEKRERRLQRWNEIELSGVWNTKNVFFRKVLIRKGIPDHYRAKMWYQMSGADQLAAQIPGLYPRLLQQPLDTEVANQIELDIHRTFPTNKHYKRESVGVTRLRNVLKAFANFVPSAGYCQSFNFLAAILLMFMDEERTFLTLVQMVDSRVQGKGMNLLGYYKDGMTALKRDLVVLEMVLQSRLKRLYAHLKANGVDFTCICAEWFLCLFSISLPITTVLRVWDALLHEGDKILFRVAFALFKVHENTLLRHNNDILVYCKSMASGIVQHDELLKVAFYHLSAFRRSDIQEMRLQAMDRISNS